VGPAVKAAATLRACMAGRRGGQLRRTGDISGAVPAGLGAALWRAGAQSSAPKRRWRMSVLEIRQLELQDYQGNPPVNRRSNNLEDVIVRIAVISLVGYVLFVPLGYLHLAGRLRPLVGGLAGALSGFAAGIVLNWPDFEPPAVVVLTTGLFTVAFGLVTFVAVRTFPPRPKM